MWGLGVLGLSRQEFYTSSLGEFKNRIKGFLLRETEIKNIGNRRIFSAIVNGLNAFGKSRIKSESELWPMSLDEKGKKEIPKSEEMVEKHFDMLKKIWPDIDGKD